MTHVLAILACAAMFAVFGLIAASKAKAGRECGGCSLKCDEPEAERSDA